MALKVIGAGFGRTGTTSLKDALELLGFEKCHHMMEVIPSPAQIRFFDQRSRGERPAWDDVFKGFDAAVDWPSVTYYKELMAHYPDAKVILTAREPEAWHKSVLETIYPTSTRVPRWLFWVRSSIRTWVEMVTRQIWLGTFDGKFEDREYAIKVYRDHVNEVMKIVPGDRLLVHSPGDGWVPLCDFLGKDVPSQPYPHSNESAQIKRMLKIFDAIRYLPHVLAVLIAVWIGYELVG